MSDLAEWLKDQRDLLNSNRDLAAEDMAIRQFPALLTAVEKVLELHTRVVTDQHIDGPKDVCEQCSEDRMFALWPCETMQAIEGAINE